LTRVANELPSGRRWLSLAALTAALLVLLTAPLGTAAENAADFILNLINEGIRLVSPDVPQAQRTERFRELLKNNFDVPGVGRFALGRYWNDLTPDQQREYLRLLQEWLAATYSERLGQYGTAPFRITNARVERDGASVTSEFSPANGPPLKVKWQLTGQSGQYRITDVSIAEVSMELTLRNEFVAVIQRNKGRANSIIATLQQQLRPVSGQNPYAPLGAPW